VVAAAVAWRTPSSPRRTEVLQSVQERHVGCVVACRWRILPTSELAPKDAELIGGLNANPNTVAFDLNHGDRDAITDEQLFAGLPA
jgi:hypothetical protein